MFASVNVSFRRSNPCTLQRFFMNSSHYLNKYAGREAKMLNKLMNTSKKKRKYFIYETPTPSGGALNLGKEYRCSKENSRRIAVLNKLFIKNISDLLVTGSFTQNVMENGLEITKVEMTSDFNRLNVFWTTNNEKNLEALEAILPDLGYSLRHELTQLQIIGKVPLIVFVKDKNNTNMLKVDALLKIADYGEDYEPYNTGSDFKLNPDPQVNINQKEEDCLGTDETCKNEGQQIAVELMPVMRQDTFNLDHDRIMKKIMNSMKKSRALHRFEPNLAITGEGASSSSNSGVAVDNMTKKERKEAMAKFILERRLIKERKYRDKYDAQLNVPVYQINDIEEDIEYEDFCPGDYLDDYEEIELKKENI